MTGKIKRRSLRCGGRPKADFGSLFTSVIAPALNATGSIVDESIGNNKTITNGVINNNTTIPSDPTKTPTMRLGGRKKCWIGAAIGAATSIAGSLFGAAAQKREMRRQKSIQDWQNTTQEAANMSTALNNNQDYQEDYLRQFRTAARLGKTLGAKGIYITDGGDATKIGNNTYLLRGGSHEDVNETGQTGIGINIGGNEVEAEGGEIAQKKNGALRIFSAQPILGNGMSPAQAILRGYNKDKVFSQQQAFKKRNGLKDDGSKLRNGGLTSKDRGSSKHPYPSVSSKDFAGGNRSYPIPTKADAVDALRLAGLHGRSDVRSKVFNKYPSLRPKAAFGVPNKAQIIRNVQQANKVMQAAKASQAAQRTAYAAKEAKDFYRGLGINIPVGRNQIYNPTFRSSEIAAKIKDSNDALRIYLNNTHLPKGIRLTPVNQDNISRSAARIINPREAEIVRMGIPIGQSAKNMTNGANPFLYAPRNSNEILEGLSRVISSAKQGAKSAGQRIGNKLTSSSIYRNPTFAERVRDTNGKLVWKQNYKYKPWVKATAGAAGTAGVIGLGMSLSNTNSKSKNTKAQLDAHGKPISQYIARPQAQQQSRPQGKKVTPVQKPVVVPKQVNKTVPQYKGNTTKGNYQLHDGETRTINGIKYTRRGNAIINHKTNVTYIYDKNGNYTGKADYSKVGNFNQAFDAARAAGRSQFINRAGKYNSYSTIKETNAKKERLNRIVGARRVARRMGGISLRPKALGGMYVPFNKRYTSIYDAPDYGYDYNGGNALGSNEVVVTAKRIKPTFMKPNNDAMNLIKVPKEEDVPYMPQKHNRSRTIFSGGDYLGLGIDTLAALSTGLVNYNTAGKYTLPDRAPIIQASKLPTTYNVNPEIEEVKRYRDRLTGQTFNNTSSSVAALNRSSAINLDALSNLSKLWATKENEENKMLTEDAKNQQTVAAQNVQNELARQSEIARIKNEAIQAKGDALNIGLSGLSQAWTNFWTAGRTAYEDDQARRAMVASSKDATPTRLIEMGYDLSPDLAASLYRTAKDDRTKRFYLSRLSSAQRQRYGIN